MSRFRLGLLVGLVLGYYYGTKAGRERYLQLRRAMDRARHSGLAGRGGALVDKVRHRSAA